MSFIAVSYNGHYRILLFVYRVAQRSKPQTVVHIFAKILTNFQHFFNGHIVLKNFIKYTTTNCVATLPCKVFFQVTIITIGIQNLS